MSPCRPVVISYSMRLALQDPCTYVIIRNLFFIPIGWRACRRIAANQYVERCSGETLGMPIIYTTLPWYIPQDLQT